MSRKKERYNLQKKNMVRTVQWAHDFDYLDKLSESEKDWMNKFIGEYYDGAPKATNTDDNLHQGTYKCETCKGTGKEKLKTGVKVKCGACKGKRMIGRRKECYRRKNKVNNDLLEIAKRQGKLTNYDENKDQSEED